MAVIQGASTSHQAMPPFAFRPSEIDALIPYMDALRITQHGQIDAARPGRGRPFQEI